MPSMNVASSQCPRCNGLLERLTLYDAREETDADRCLLCRRVYYSNLVRRRLPHAHHDAT